MAEMNPKTVTMSLSSEADFLQYVARLNRRAAKLGMEPLVVTRGSEVSRKKTAIYRENGESHEARRDVACVQYTLNLPVVKLNGWSMAAIVEATEAGNLIHNIPHANGEFVEIPAEFRTMGTACQHCNTNRQRKNLYIVRHDDGSFKQVASSCIRDFLGHDTTIFEFVSCVSVSCDEYDGDWESGGVRPILAHDLDEVLKVASAMIRKGGYVSRKVSFETGAEATSERVLVQLTVDWEDPKKMLVQPEDYTTEVLETAANTLEWMKSLPVDGSEGYVANLAVLGKAGFVTERGMGLAVSAISAYQREQAKIAKAVAEAQSQYVGTVGEKVVITVTVMSVINHSGMYGATGIHKMVDASGNVLMWFASGSTEWLKIGEKVTLKATVKGHGEYKGCKQTSLTRVKALTDEEATEEQARLVKAAVRASKKAAKEAVVASELKEVA